MKQLSKQLMRDFGGSIIITVIGLISMLFYGGITAMFITAVLIVLEISLSFDNAVVNATVLKEMDEKWQKIFLTWGILIAVFGMRLVFPIAIVSVATGLGPVTVFDMALHDPDTYSQHLTAHHAMIVSYGGMFLLMVFLDYFLDEGKDIHWIKEIEEKLASLGRLQSVELLFAMVILLIIAGMHGDDVKHKAEVLGAGLAGLMTYMAVDSLVVYMKEQEAKMIKNGAKQGGLALFIYLEILDASFSFDGVIGAFAISKDIIVIMVGLGVGALFVRSLTVYLVHKGTLDEYQYLEHGAHYAIGALALIMLVNTKYHIPEVITGLIGVVLIYLSVKASIDENKALEKAEANKPVEEEPQETVPAEVIKATTTESNEKAVEAVEVEILKSEEPKAVEAEVVKSEASDAKKDESVKPLEQVVDPKIDVSKEK